MLASLRCLASRAVAACPGVLAAAAAATAQSLPAELLPHEFESDGMFAVVDEVATGLAQPVALAFLPDGRGVLAERGSGSLSLIDLSTGQRVPVTGLPATALAGEGGVHDVKVDPDFSRTQRIYFTYALARPDSSTSVAVARARLEGHSLAELEILLEDDQSHEEVAHYGARIALSGPYLFVSMGDRRSRDVPQDLASRSGKVLRLHQDGAIPEDNPFVHDPTATPEVWSYGHRNPQGLAIHPSDGTIWVSEHGPQGGDEINRVLPGRNYGWPLVSFGEEYGGGPVGTGAAELPGIEGPHYYYRPSIAPSGAEFYTGSTFSAWTGDLFVGALGLRHLNRLVMRAGRVIREDRLLQELDERIRFVSQAPDGTLYLGADSGRLLHVRPR